MGGPCRGKDTLEAGVATVGGGMVEGLLNPRQQEWEAATHYTASAHQEAEGARVGSQVVHAFR